MKISIVILNYNGLKNTLECIKSIQKSVAYLSNSEIIVVDNNSSDKSKDVLSEVVGVLFIANKENLGFSGGMNVGIKKALINKADYVLVINNDIVIDRLFFNKLLQNLNTKEIVAPKIYFTKGYEFHKKRYKSADLGKVIWFAGGEIDWDNVIGLHRGVDEVDRGQYSLDQGTDFATGACMLVSKQIFKKIGYFDEKYFLYLEDMDFCVRAKKAGFKIKFNPHAIAWHKNAASAGGSGSKLQDYYISRNRLLFSLKFAKVNTKLAVFKQIISQSRNPIKRKALFDFLLCNLGRGSYK